MTIDRATKRIAALSAVAVALFPAFDGDEAEGSRGRPRGDLVVVAVSRPAAAITTGRVIRLGGTVRNVGSARAARSILGFYLSPERKRSGREVRLAGEIYVRALRARQRFRNFTTLRVPPMTRRGAYFLIACADDRRAVRERNEQNNCRAAQSRVSIVVDPALRPPSPPSPPLRPPSPPPPPPSPPSPPANVSLPTTVGTAEVGRQLSAAPGTWTGTAPLTFRYAWHRCNALGAACGAIADAAAATYGPASADVGSTLRVAVTATNAHGSATAASVPTATVVAGSRLYAQTSPFNTAIAADARVDRNSARYVAALKEVADARKFTISLRSWTVPVYEAAATTERLDVRLTASWRGADWMRGVPIPAAAAPDPEEDGHLTVLDRARGCEYDFYRARKVAGHWYADWGNTLLTSGSGVYPFAYSTRGSGFSNLGGLIWPEELQAGEIPHALMFSYPHTSALGAVSPASETDGQSTRADALPEGARLQLDPTLDLERLPLRPYERTIARALQRYGMYLGDTGGGLNLYAVHPQSFSSDRYAGLLPAVDYPGLENIPIERFRVLELGEVTPPALLRSRARLVSPCAVLE